MWHHRSHRVITIQVIVQCRIRTRRKETASFGIHVHFFLKQEAYIFHFVTLKKKIRKKDLAKKNHLISYFFTLQCPNPNLLKQRYQNEAEIFTWMNYDEYANTHPTLGRKTRHLPNFSKEIKNEATKQRMMLGIWFRHMHVNCERF